MKNNVLVIAAHSDDEVLGCGGVISKLAGEGSQVTVMFMTNGVGARGDAISSKASDLRELHSKKAANILGISQVKQFDFPDNSLDTVPLLELTKEIEQLIDLVKPQTVFTHYLNDLNIDHSIVARATLTATRPIIGSPVKRLFGYEVNSSTEWFFGNTKFSPNYFIDISKSFITKVKAMRAYENELKTSPHPRSIEGIKALAALRGSAVGCDFAEAFYVYRFLEH